MGALEHLDHYVALGIISWHLLNLKEGPSLIAFGQSLFAMCNKWGGDKS
jgi:hypothetical protein